VLLAARDELDLCSLLADIDCGDWALRRTKRDGSPYAHTAFYEPDLDGALTAVALEPAAWPLVRKLPLVFAGGSGASVSITNTPGGAS